MNAKSISGARKKSSEGASKEIAREDYSAGHEAGYNACLSSLKFSNK